MVLISPIEDAATSPGRTVDARPGARVDRIAPAVFVVLALFIGVYDVAGSGPVWPDSPRYANGGAMIHDWLASGEYRHPYTFALENYNRYPAFSLPYHPPAYPGLLGLFFLATGVSYAAARVFIGLCLGACGSIFYATLRKQGIGPVGAAGGALLLLTAPEVVLWSRDTMSEVPALVFILAGSALFLRWLRTSRPADAWGAFALAEVAFMCRVTTCGVLPAWFLFAAATGRFRRLLSPQLALASAGYLGLNVAYLKFASKFSKFETTDNPLLGSVGRFTWSNLSYYPAHLPAMVGWGGLAAALLGAVLTLRAWKRRPPGAFWLSWLASYYGFQWAVATNEQRYFLFALPGVFGLAASLFDPGGPASVRRWAAPALLALALACAAWRSTQVPRGVVGYEAVAQRIRGFEKPGNVLLACPQFQDLIFRVRGLDPKPPRQMVRSDRTLAIRLSPYTGVAPSVLARSAADVLATIRRSRARYVVTCAPDDPDRDDRVEEMALVHDVLASSPGSFAKVSESPLLTEFGDRGRGPSYRVFVWEYLGGLPEGPGRVPVPIPTADMEVR